MKNETITQTVNFSNLEYEKINKKLEKSNIQFNEYARDIILNNIHNCMNFYLNVPKETEVVRLERNESFPYCIENYMKLAKVTLDDALTGLMINFKYEESKEHSQIILENTYQIAIEYIEKTDINTLLEKLQIGYISIEKINIIKNIESEESLFGDLFKNSRKYYRIKNHTHYFSNLYKNQAIHFKNAQPYFFELASALVNGYLQQEILMNIKDSKIADSDNKYLINKKYTEKCGVFMVAKKIDMTLNNSIQYRKSALGVVCVKKKSHTKEYDNFAIITLIDL